MDKEYIEREALLKMPPFTKFGGQPNEYNDGYLDCAADARKAIRNANAADVVEVRHGHWYFTEYEYFSCSECGESYYNGCDSTHEAKEKLRNGEYHNYCHNCGARMDGKALTNNG